MTSGVVQTVLAVALTATPAPLGAADAEPAHGSADEFLVRLDELAYLDVVTGLDEAVRFERPPLVLDVLRSTLGPGTAIVAWHLEGNEIRAAVVAADTTITRSWQDPLVPVFTARMRRWAEQSAPFDLEAASGLYLALFGPFVDTIATRAHLVLVASGPLRGLPFEVLPMAAFPDLPLAEQMFVTKRWAVSYEPTIASRLTWSGRGQGTVRRLRPDDATLSLDLGEAPIRPGAVVATEPGGGVRTAAMALALARAGARGALLGPPETDPAPFLLLYKRLVSRGRPIVSATREARLARLRDAPGSPEIWAWPLLWAGP